VNASILSCGRFLTVDYMAVLNLWYIP
jgi:hypothetical protein